MLATHARRGSGRRTIRALAGLLAGCTAAGVLTGLWSAPRTTQSAAPSAAAPAAPSAVDGSPAARPNPDRVAPRPPLFPDFAAEVLPGTTPLKHEGDLAADMVAGIGKWLDRRLASAHERRAGAWSCDITNAETYERSVAGRRALLAKVVGVIDKRVPSTGFETVAPLGESPVVARNGTITVTAVRWPVLPGVWGEGLLVTGRPDQRRATIIFVPDAGVTPEDMIGVHPHGEPRAPRVRQIASLAMTGYDVLVPVVIDRGTALSRSDALNRVTDIPHREFLYRMALPVGRHLIGLEVQRVLAAVDAVRWHEANPPVPDEASPTPDPGAAVTKVRPAKTKTKSKGAAVAPEKSDPAAPAPVKSGRPRPPARPAMPVAVAGWGEGGRIALFAAALDTRVSSALVSGAFGPGEDVWRRPIDRTVWRFVEDFGDAGLAALITPRGLIVEPCPGPVWSSTPPPAGKRTQAAPGALTAEVDLDAVYEEARRARALGRPKGTSYGAPGLATHVAGQPFHYEAMQEFIRSVDGNWFGDAGEQPLPDRRAAPDAAARHARQFRELVDFLQGCLRTAEVERTATLAVPGRDKPDTWATAVVPLRERFWSEVIGKLPPADQPPNPRSRKILDKPGFAAWEVTLDVYADVSASGVLLLPKDLKPGQRRPVVVCQHGLEGRPAGLLDPAIKNSYHGQAARLAEAGFIVFAPQNPYIGGDAFRVLQRKANPLGLSLFSFIIRQHEVITAWLGRLPCSDPSKIAFYGLSYGGKTAMRVPAVLPAYCLSICSADFNEWIGKNASVHTGRSYQWTHEYEMPEFDLGRTFGYAEMAGLICPRPFMVERGHSDGVGDDEWVAYEFAKVRRHYAAMGIGDRAEIEFFVGGHEIKLEGTLRFLLKHLGDPRKP